MRKAFLILLLAAAICVVRHADAQYYTWGADAASLRWSELKTDDVRIIHPDTSTAIARRTLYCVERIQPWVGYGFRYGPMRIPMIIHPENFESNGLVMWLPKRVELLTSPAIGGYSMPWYKQLTAHEYRHAVQYNNLNRGTIRFLSYLLGQQGSTVGLLCLPVWLLEGDAVMSETAMSTYGRGLQPRFTIEYRAMGNIARERRNPDKWFCGSYRDFVPDHYQLGYQIASHAYDRFGENIWDKVAWYGSRNPYLFFTTSISLRKFYRTSVPRLFRGTFDDLHRHWDSLPAVANSTRPLVEMPRRNYTVYAHPIALGDSLVAAVRSDFRRPERLVLVDPETGDERLLARIGRLSTRPVYDPSTRRIWWTEYRRSKLFEQRVGSELCYLELDKRRPRTSDLGRNMLYPTPLDDGLAWVEYTPDGRYEAVVLRRDSSRTRYSVPPFTEIHGLAWDDATRRLCFLATDDSGMWIGAFAEQSTVEQLTPGAYITLSDLRAANGKLYFGSIASGKDEAHCLDLKTGRQWQLTESTYGSFSPAPRPDGSVVATTYSSQGYALSVQREPLDRPVAPSKTPRDVVNPPRKRWEVINLDTVRFTPIDSIRSLEKHPARRYRKVPHLFKIHSWAPAAFNPFEAVDEHNLTLNWGVTLLSQNLLSSAEAFFSWGWNQAEGSLLRMGVRYYGLGLQFDIDGAYGGNQIIYSLAQHNQQQPSPDKYYSIGATATLPLVYERGYRTRRLNLSASWNFSNGMVANLGRVRYDSDTHSITNLEYIGYTHGLHKVVLGAGFSEQVRLAHRDFLPRWGYAVNASYAFNPSNNDFSDLLAGFARIYTPGLFPHHSFTAAATYQTSLGGFRTPEGQRLLTYKSAYLIPEGFTSTDIASNRYVGASAAYQLPLWYPEGGIPSVIYFKRIRLNLGVSYAQFLRYYGLQQANRVTVYGRTERLWSWGGDLIFDVNVFRQPASATSSIRLSIYKPNHGKGLWISGGIGLPF